MIIKQNVLLLSLIFMFLGCSHTPKDPNHDIQFVDSFVQQGDVELAPQWWESFNSKDINQLIEQALTDNYTLKANALREKSSELSIAIAQASLLPSVNFTANSNNNSNDFSKINSASLGLAASWEIDLWGEFEAGENRAFWQHQESISTTRLKANLVAGNTIDAWFSVLSASKKQQVLIKQHQRTNAALKVISRRFSMGKNSVTNIWQQEKLVKSIEVKQSKNYADLYISKQKLQLWLGQSDDFKLDDYSDKIPELPALPKLGIPLIQLNERPDIKQAFAKVKAADEYLAISMAEQLPRLTIRANYNTSKSSVADLFDDWAGNLIASLVVPVFDSGRRSNVVKQRELELQALILDYKQVWLEAIAAVNKALVSEEQLNAVVKNLQLQLTLANKTEQLTLIQYLNSKSNFINLLNAQEDILALELQLIDASKILLLNRVLLYRELSHGDFTRDENQPLIEES